MFCASFRDWRDISRSMKPDTYIIEGEKLGLTKLSADFISPEYLGWLNDPLVQKYTSRRGRKISRMDLEEFIKKSENSGDWHLAIIRKDTGAHIGNLSLNSLDLQNKSAELSIMLGDRAAWGQGYGVEATALASKFAFNTLDLHRLWAESPNPAFNAIMVKLGWRREGLRRQAFSMGDSYVDLECWSLLKTEQLESRGRLSTALLMIDGSPMGLKYLETLLANNMPPALILVSHLPKLSAAAQETVKQRTGGRFIWKPLAELLARQEIPVYFTASHNSEYCQDILRGSHADVAILGGTGIIKKPLIDIPRLGIANVHPGILPKYRGCSAPEWSVYNDDPVGATCHFVTEEIDAGDIIYSETAKIARGDLYNDMRLKAYNLQPEVLVKGLQILARPDYKDYVKPNVDGSYFKSMSEKELAEVEEKLKSQQYKCYAE